MPVVHPVDADGGEVAIGAAVAQDQGLVAAAPDPAAEGQGGVVPRGHGLRVEGPHRLGRLGAEDLRGGGPGGAGVGTPGGDHLVVRGQGQVEVGRLGAGAVGAPGGDGHHHRLGAAGGVGHRPEEHAHLVAIRGEPAHEVLAGEVGLVDVDPPVGEQRPVVLGEGVDALVGEPDVGVHLPAVDGAPADHRHRARARRRQQGVDRGRGGGVGHLGPRRREAGAAHHQRRHHAAADQRRGPEVHQDASRAAHVSLPRAASPGPSPTWRWCRRRCPPRPRSRCSSWRRPPG